MKGPFSFAEVPPLEKDLEAWEINDGSLNRIAVVYCNSEVAGKIVELMNKGEK